MSSSDFSSDKSSDDRTNCMLANFHLMERVLAFVLLVQIHSASTLSWSVFLLILMIISLYLIATFIPLTVKLFFLSLQLN